MSNKTIKWLVLIWICLFLIDCAANSVYLRQGKDFLFSGQYDKAVTYFESALKQNPTNVEIKHLLYRAQISSYYFHLARARRYRELNAKELAVKEYKLALDIFPMNKTLISEYNSYIGKKDPLKKPVFKSVIKPPVTLNVDSQQKVTLDVKTTTPITKIFKLLGKFYKVNFIFDKDFRDFMYSVEIKDITFFAALNQLCMVSASKYRILDSSSVLIYPDNTFKKRTFSLRGVKIFYLTNIKAEDAKKTLLALFRDQQIVVEENAIINALIVKATYNTLVEVEKFLHSIDKRKGEVELDVEIFEVNRSFIKKIGADFGTVLSTLSAGAVEEGETTSTINSTLNIANLDNTNFFLTLPTVALNILASNEDSKIIAKPNLRGVDGEQISFMVGDELPVPQTQFAQVAAGGVGTIPQTTYQYRKVGVSVKLTPTIHRNDEVTIKIELSIDFVTSYVDNVFPILGKRELENFIRLKEGETTIIGGFIRDEIRGSLNGIPGLSRIPVLGKLFGNSDKTIRQNDVIISITPRLIRKIMIDQKDREPIWIDTQASPSAGAAPSTDSPTSRRLSRSPQRPAGNGISISPARRRMPQNTFAYFSIRLNSNVEITALSVSGSISGGKAEISDLKTDFFNSDQVKVLKNVSESSFDTGYTFVEGSAKNSILAQLKVKFMDKGEYTINLDNVTAYSKDRQKVNLSASSAVVEVY